MSAASRILPLLRRSVLQLPNHAFCSRVGLATQTCHPYSRGLIAKPSPAKFFQSLRYQTTHASSYRSSPLVESVKKNGKSRSFPETSDRIVAYWLLGSAASVFGIVVFGGLTRLTESGLSITEWRPVTGSIPPFSAADWEAEFSKYRSSPEFIRLNPRMELSEFKQIYWMEWTHRLWGRVIGVTFLLPTVYFIARRRVASHMALKLVGISGLIGFQGFLGWWMVKSGLKDDLFDTSTSVPRVSQYRLAAHLGTAFVVYSGMLVSGLSILRERAMLSSPASALSLIDKLSRPTLGRFRFAVTALTALVFTTAMSGALVAGLDAGLIYNEFPYMGLGLTPPKAELWDHHYSRESDGSDLWWRNMLENPSLVQLDHRVLGTTTFTAITCFFLAPRFSSKLRSTLPPDVRKGLMGVMHLASLQVVLGISTLIYMVPTWLAAMHQAGALALLTGVLVLGTRLRVSPRIARMVRQAVQSKQGTTAARQSKNPIIEKTKTR